MANKVGKYSAFKDWLLWCRNKPKSTATKIASYLRRCEEDLLLKEPNHCSSFSEMHTILKEIDCGKRPYSDIDIAIEKLRDINEAIGQEIKLDSRNQISEVEYETLNGWQGAFNAYLKFLSDVTDCFNMGIAKCINTRIDCGGKRKRQLKRGYSKRVFLFRNGTYKDIMRKLNLNLLDKALDAFSESVEALLGPDANRNIVPVEFLVLPEAMTTDVVNWRQLLLDGIRIEDGRVDKNYIESDDEYYYDKLLSYGVRNVKFKIKYSSDNSLKTSANLFTELVDTLLKFQSEIISQTDNTHEVFSFKECLTSLNEEGLCLFKKHLPDTITKLYNLILEYARQYKLTMIN